MEVAGGKPPANAAITPVQHAEYIMKKLRKDSNWAPLTRENKEKLEDWIFEENLSYKEVLERAQKEFNLVSSISGLTRYANRLAEERRTRSQENALNWLSENTLTPHDNEVIEEGAFKMLAIKAYEMGLSGRVPMKELRQVMTLILKRRRQATRDKHLALAAKQEERKANLEYGKGVERLMQNLQKNGPKRFPTKEEMEMFNELNRSLKTEKEPPPQPPQPPPQPPSQPPSQPPKT